MKDAKGHGSNTRGGPKLPRGTTAAYAGRDRFGRTYTAAVRDYDRFRSQNPDFPNAEDYRTDKTSNAQAAEALASTLKSTQAPVHDAFGLSRERMEHNARLMFGPEKAAEKINKKWGK